MPNPNPHTIEIPYPSGGAFKVSPQEITVVPPKCIDPDKVEPPKPPKGHRIARFKEAVLAEWAFYHPHGPPETYTDGSPMQPVDAMIYGGLTILCWTLYIVLATVIVALVVVAFTGS